MTTPPYGLTAAGFLKKRLPDLKAALEDSYENAYGSAINRNADSVIGQNIGIAAKGDADIWEALEDLYFSQYPNTAEGVALDNVCLLLGITRLPASSTTVIAACRGVEGTTISAGAIASIAASNTNFKALANTVISRSNTVKITLLANSILPNAIYTLLINGKVSVITSPATSPTARQIAALFVDRVRQEHPEITSTDNLDGTFTLAALDGRTSFAVTVDDKLSTINVWTPVKFTATGLGKILCLKSGLTRIDSPTTGWAEVNNFVDGVMGRDIETDEELRIRRLASTRVSGAATVESIKARLLQEVSGVSGVSIFENRSGYTDSSGRPAHSFETLVTGGDDHEIADEIWKVKPAGIETFGNVTIFITDSNGDLQPIHFSRATYIFTWLKIDITLYDEESFPADGVAKVKAAVLETAQKLGIGNDVILQRLFGPAYSAVPGISTLTISIGTSKDPATPPTSYQATNLPISAVEVAEFDSNRITAQVVG